MAKSEFQIRLEFGQAIRQANKLEEIASKIDRIASNDLTDCMRRVANDWKSESSTSFQKKGQQVTANLKCIAKEYKKAADVVRRIANNTYNAEMTALELAKKREY